MGVPQTGWFIMENQINIVIITITIMIIITPN